LTWQKAGGGFFQSSSVRVATSRPIAENRARRRPPSHAGTFTLPSSRRCGRIARTLTIRLSSFNRSFRSSAGRGHSIEPFAATDAFHGAVGTCLVVASYLLALSPCSDILFRDNETASPAVRAACLRWQSVSTRLIEDACWASRSLNWWRWHDASVAQPVPVADASSRSTTRAFPQHTPTMMGSAK